MCCRRPHFAKSNKVRKQNQKKKVRDAANSVSIIVTPPLWERVDGESSEVPRLGQGAGFCSLASLKIPFLVIRAVLWVQRRRHLAVSSQEMASLD